MAETRLNPRVGFIGLGDQGGPMARRIVEEGFPLTLWARRAASLQAFAEMAADVAPSPRELAERCDIVCVCVYDDAGVNEVVNGERGVLAGLSPGSILVLHSTVHPDTCLGIARRAEGVGVDVLDAPVSGGGVAASQRRLVVMVGGERHAFDRASPVLSTYADLVRLMGPVGTGTLVKLVNNMLMTAQLGISEDALELAAALGVDRQAVAEVVSRCSGGGVAMVSLAHAGDLHGFANLGGPLLAKDARILQEVVANAGVDEAFAGLLPAAQRALRVFAERVP